jgi:ATP-dependent helicase/nuclease subunit A
MIAEFFATDLGRMMINADHIHREQPFILKEYARNINPLWEKSEDYILIQGIIDCWFEYDGEYYIADFKTDRIKDEVHLRSLNEKYSVQLGYYKKALEEFTKKPVRAAYICYLRKNIIVNIKE